KATLNLFILEELQDRRTAAVGADALTSAYELTLTVEYELLSAKGEAVGTVDTVTVTRTFDFIAEGASSGAREEAKLLSEMRREIAQQLIRRMSALSANLTSDSAEPSSPTPVVIPDSSSSSGTTAEPASQTTPAMTEQNGQT